MKTDGHVHTRLCHHASGEMEDYVLAAIALKLERIIFLEHLEMGINYFESTWLTQDDFSYYFKEGRRLQEKYSGTLEIGLGVEVGFNPDRIRQLQSFLDRYHWDRVGISYHFLDVHGEHLNLLSRKKHNIAAYDGVGVERILDAYFSGLRVAVEELPGDVLCHLDAVLRYHPDAKDFDFFTPACDLLDRIAEKGMSLEVNTSGYPIRDQPFPSIDILKAAAGRNITLVAGSDAHRPADVGRYFDRLSVIVKEIQKIR